MHAIANRDTAVYPSTVRLCNFCPGGSRSGFRGLQEFAVPKAMIMIGS